MTSSCTYRYDHCVLHRPNFNTISWDRIGETSPNRYQLHLFAFNYHCYIACSGIPVVGREVLQMTPNNVSLAGILPRRYLASWKDFITFLEPIIAVLIVITLSTHYLHDDRSAYLIWVISRVHSIRCYGILQPNVGWIVRKKKLQSNSTIIQSISFTVWVILYGG